MRLLVKFYLLFVLLLVPFFLFAQGTKAVAYVNFQQIQQQLPAYVAANQEVEAFTRGAMAELNRKQKDLEQKYNASTPKSDTATHWSNQRKAFQAYYQEVGKKQQEITDKKEQVLTIVNEKVKKAVEEVAEEKGYSGVMDTSNLTYYDSSHELTSAVLTKLTAK